MILRMLTKFFSVWRSSDTIWWRAQSALERVGTEETPEVGVLRGEVAGECLCLLLSAVKQFVSSTLIGTCVARLHTASSYTMYITMYQLTSVRIGRKKKQNLIYLSKSLARPFQCFEQLMGSQGLLCIHTYMYVQWWPITHWARRVRRERLPRDS